MPGPTWYQFDTVIQIAPSEPNDGAFQVISGKNVRPFQLTPSQQGLPFPIRFEELMEQFAQWPRMFCEWDGSFVWTGEESISSEEELRWQLDGNLYDRDDRLIYIELKGICPQNRLEQFLTACGWPQDSFMFGLTNHGTFLNEADFREVSALSEENFLKMTGDSLRKR
ncbi:Hypothetical protein PBC10988_37080 [Planctomycetales bacterium 10988]|nr:Hypothetical protein PBC10988_37080 [Planctomycetales bacterium 10988]